MNALITAAEAALADLKSRHNYMSQSCPGPSGCRTAAAIAALEVEIAIAKRGSYWHPIATLDRTTMQFVLTHRDGEQRAMLWNPNRGFWECAEPMGYRYPGPEPTEWMELPESPTDPDPEFQAVAGFDPKEHLPVMINPPA